jgi:hypothetical protein
MNVRQYKKVIKHQISFSFFFILDGVRVLVP